MSESLQHFPKMHILQQKQNKLNEKELNELLKELNISRSQLPKILSSDPSLPEGCIVGDVIKVERKVEDKIKFYYRVVI